MKLKLILAMIMPMMELAVRQLRDKDENSTGLDDVVANQLDSAIRSLEEYLTRV